jgi:glycosyltransferase involved in cell wall biosynthesis
VKKSSTNRNFIIIANAALGKGFSGSDRIFIELAKRLKSNFDISICVWEEGYDMCQRQNLMNVRYEKWFLHKWKKLPFILSYFFRILSGVYYSLKFDLKNYRDEDCYFYSASDFWQDFIPMLIFKLKYPNSKFIASFYLEAPNPLIGFRREYEKKYQLPKFKDLFYYIAQLLPKLLIPVISNFIFVTSKPDKDYFVKRGFKKDKIIIITGGVDFNKYKNIYSNSKKIYDAIFYGRFHPQKGVLELIDIWNILVKSKPDSKLVMIGDGPLYNLVLERIKKYSLEDKITLMGHMDDSLEKLKLFSQSKVVVHPAVYDSGGMASAEIMYLGIPGVSFDLEALKTYYPKGMIKTKCFNLEDFAMNIYNLLSDKDLYSITSKDAKDCVLENFDWDKKCRLIMDSII